MSLCKKRLTSISSTFFIVLLTRYTGWDKGGFPVVRTQPTELVLVLSFTNYCIIVHANNYKATFLHPV